MTSLSTIRRAKRLRETREAIDEARSTPHEATTARRRKQLDAVRAFVAAWMLRNAKAPRATQAEGAA